MEVRNQSRIDEISDSVQTSWGQFSDKFAFNFRKLREDDGIAEWKKLVEQCDLQTLLNCLDVISETWDSKFGIPKGPQVRRTYKEAWGRTNMRAEGSNVFWCSKCQNSGALWIVYFELRHNERPGGVVIKNINGVLCAILNPGDKGHDPKRMKTCPIPCVCVKGRIYGSRKDGDNIESKNDYWEWSHKGQMEAFEWIDRQVIPTKTIQKVEKAA